MVFKSAIPLLSLFLLSSTQAFEGLNLKAWKNTEFKSVQIHDLSKSLYKKSSENFSHEVPLTIVHFKEYFWKKKDLKLAVKMVAKAYGKSCGLRFSPATLVSFKKGGRLHLNSEDSYDHNDPDGEFTLLKKLPELPKPIGFFVENHSDNCDWDNGEQCFSWLPGEARFSLYNEGMLNNNTFWVSEEIFDYNREKDAIAKTLAHELAHVLVNQKDMDLKEGGDVPNLMKNVARLMSMHANKEQCERIYQNPLVKTIN